MRQDHEMSKRFALITLARSGATQIAIATIACSTVKNADCDASVGYPVSKKFFNLFACAAHEVQNIVARGTRYLAVLGDRKARWDANARI